jgi:hydroxyethylthiazole kinase-like uncharacterized protein yjeF
VIPVLTSKEIKDLDDLVKASADNAGFALMQKASRIIFDLVISEVLKRQKDGQESTVLILCGKGNNGGDGLLSAAYLIEQGYPVKVFLFADTKNLENEAKQALDYLEETKKSSCDIIQTEEDLFRLKDFLNNMTGSSYHLFVLDAIYGIGYKTDRVDPVLKKAADLVNSSKKEKTVIAVDTPSGMDNDEGALSHNIIKADITLSLGFPKLGSFFYPARAFLGIMIVGDLGYSEKDFLDTVKSQTFFVDNVKNFFPGRALNGSKYDHGQVYALAGIKEMSGAAALMSKSCFKVGAGMVKVFTEAQAAINSYCPEVITHKIDDQEIFNDEKVDCYALGPGLGVQQKELVFDLIKKTNKPIVIDADAINYLKDNLDILKEAKSEIVITPHFGEYKRLFPDDQVFKPTDVITSLKKNSSQYGITILLKGSPTIIADPCGEVFVVPFGNSGLATAGTGDVLTGMIAGLMAQSFKRQNKFLSNSKLITQNSILAAYLHGKTAEIISSEVSEYSMLASDIVNNMHRSIKSALN